MGITNQDVLHLAKEYETPFYLYDGNFLFEHYHNLREKLETNVDIFLSLKANNNANIAMLFKTWGSGIEVASMAELYLAERVGFKPENIIFSGPGKKKEELRYAIEKSIYSIIVESILELKYIQEISLEMNSTINVGVRINPENDLANSTIKMAGVARQFGIDESQLDSFFKILDSCPNINFMGIHVYTGTQIFEEKNIIESFKNTVRIARDIFFRFGKKSNMINLGGGFGVPYYSHELPLDIEQVISELNYLVIAEKEIFKDTRFIIESGRYLLAQSGMYVMKVLYSKISKTEKFYITDGGMHHHAASTFRGRTMRNNFELRTISNKDGADEKSLEKVNIVGPLCTPEDCIGKNVYTEKLEPGDLVGVLNSGAYGLSYSPIHFLGHPIPYEILKFNDKFIQIRGRGNKEDILFRQDINKDMINIREL